MSAQNSMMLLKMITLVTVIINPYLCHMPPVQKERNHKTMTFETNIGIPIETQAFLKLVANFTEKMTNKEELTVDDHLTSVRILNTIQANKLSDKDDRYEKYIELYRLEYMQQSVSKLEATLTKGMSWYSKKHDIYIGGKPHKNSQFGLEDSFLKSMRRP